MSRMGGVPWGKRDLVGVRGGDSCASPSRRGLVRASSLEPDKRGGSESREGGSVQSGPAEWTRYQKGGPTLSCLATYLQLQPLKTQEKDGSKQ